MQKIIDFVQRTVNIPLYRVESEVISVERYLNLTSEERADIAFCEIVPAQMDRPGFGEFKIGWKTPKYMRA